jgi:hypothetical protein
MKRFFTVSRSLKVAAKTRLNPPSSDSLCCTMALKGYPFVFRSCTFPTWLIMLDDC